MISKSDDNPQANVTEPLLINGQLDDVPSDSKHFVFSGSFCSISDCFPCIAILCQLLFLCQAVVPSV